MELLGNSSEAQQELPHPTPEASEAHSQKPGGLILPSLLAWPLRKHKIQKCIASLSDPQPGATPFGPIARNMHLVTRAPLYLT